MNPVTTNFPEFAAVSPTRGRQSVVYPIIPHDCCSQTVHLVPSHVEQNSKVNKSKERMVYFPSRCNLLRSIDTYFRLLSASYGAARHRFHQLTASVCCCTSWPASSCTYIDSSMNMLPAIEESDCHNPNCSTQIALTTLILDERNLIPSGLLSQPRYLARPPPPLRRYLCHHHDGFSTTFPRLPTNPLFRASWIDSISRVLPPLGLSQYLSSVANPLPQARPSVDPLSGS